MARAANLAEMAVDPRKETVGGRNSEQQRAAHRAKQFEAHPPETSSPVASSVGAPRPDATPRWTLDCERRVSEGFPVGEDASRRHCANRRMPNGTSGGVGAGGGYAPPLATRSACHYYGTSRGSARPPAWPRGLGGVLREIHYRGRNKLADGSAVAELPIISSSPAHSVPCPQSGTRMPVACRDGTDP